MNTTLYVLRRRPEEIPRALFHASDPGVDIVLIEDAASHAVSYDDFLKKIFEADRTIVL
jgi:sulfur transfer complex TusBCD TusB component (DsrH family)